MPTLSRFAKRCAAFYNSIIENSSSPDVQLNGCRDSTLKAACIYEYRERQNQITDDLIDRIAAHPEDYDVAANTDPNTHFEAETPDE